MISREDVGSLKTSNFRFFRMQKELLSNEFNQSGCIQNDPVLHKLFEDAIAVLRLAGADDNSVAGHKISEERCQESQLQQGRSRRKKRQPEQKNEKQAERMPVITKSKRRKLERIKAPVVLLRKMRGVEVPSEEEQKSSVEQMLKYINQLPSQETFQPPPLPCVSLSVDENDVKKPLMLWNINQTLLEESKTVLTCQVKKMLGFGKCLLHHQPIVMFLWEA